MPVSTLNFEAQIDDFIRLFPERALAVFRESTKRVVSKAQDRIPVDTGFARASIRASLDVMPQIDKSSTRQEGGTYPDTGTPVVIATIAGANITDTIYVGWTANYAGFLEYGSSKQAPTGFVAISAQEWPAIVGEVSAELRGRIGG